MIEPIRVSVTPLTFGMLSSFTLLTLELSGDISLPIIMIAIPLALSMLLQFVQTVVFTLLTASLDKQ